MKNLIELKAICIKQGTQEILHNINLDLVENQIVTLIGPNGAGKTTLIKTG